MDPCVDERRISVAHEPRQDGHATHADDVAEAGLAIIVEVGRLGRERGLPLQRR